MFAEKDRMLEALENALGIDHGKDHHLTVEDRQLIVVHEMGKHLAACETGVASISQYIERSIEAARTRQHGIIKPT